MYESSNIYVLDSNHATLTILLVKSLSFSLICLIVIIGNGPLFSILLKKINNP